MKNTIEVKDGKVYSDWSYLVLLVRKTGLRSKKRRKIVKRWKSLIHKALLNYIQENA